MVDFSTMTTFILTIISVTSEQQLYNSKVPNVNTEVLKGNDAKEFTLLLQNLIKVNEGRMKSLKASMLDQEAPAYPLQRFGKALRTGLTRSKGNRHGPDITAFFVLPTHVALRSEAVVEPYKSIKSEKRKDKDLAKTDKGEIKGPLRENEYANLRASLRSCNSRSVKKCKKACREAVSKACETYSCKRKLKKVLKKECKKHCKNSFKKDFLNSDSSGGW